MVKMKKIMAICVLLLLIAVPSGIAEAGVSNDSTQNNESTSVLLTSFSTDGSSTTEKILVSEKQVVELKNTFSNLIQSALAVKSLQGLKNLIDNLIGSNNPVLSAIFKPFKKFRPILNRGFVISFGHGYKFNPFKNNLKIRKKIDFWHYSSGKLIKDRTIIFKPLALKVKVLTGLQFGFMTRFTGIYVFIPRKLPEKGYSFFMGTARRINGLQVLPKI
jgi:hypothetical protein